MLILDLIGEAFEVVFSSGGVPGPDSPDGQRRGRLAAGIVAAALIGTATFLSGSFRLAMLIAGVLVAGWVVAFSMVDVAKESPRIPWLGVLAILIGGGSVATGVAFLLGGP